VLDARVDGGRFEIRERPVQGSPGIKLAPDFRIIATCTDTNLRQLSPALLNRFVIIFVDNQLARFGGGTVRDKYRALVEQILARDVRTGR
jgi:hypothetical protein